MPRTRVTPPRRRTSASARAFLFSDLRDYTSYVEAKGDAAAARLLREYRTLVRREVARHDGGEVKTEGDSFYVVFDSASSALECAVAILRAADAQNGRDPASPLRIGVGLHAGETVEYDDQFVGSAVNIASRLAGKAGAMELLISDTLRGLVRTSQSLPMSERGALELKGVAERIRAWNVEWREPEPQRARGSAEAPPSLSAPPPAAAVGQLLCPIVVGRKAESARLADALDAAVAGRGQTIVLGGEAGVGKTKFVRDAQARAAAAGARTLLGLTRQSDGALPYAPFISAIRSGFHGLERDELGRVLQRSAPDLAELFPELGRIERAGAPTGLERHRLTVAFQHLFRAFAREAPVLLVLEDLHWADETSLELLQHLARELRDARVLILATYRSDEMHRRHPFLRALAELQRERLVTDIALKRLTPEETGELMRAAFAATDPNVTVSNEFRDAIYARSEGNPFFTEELMKALVDSGGVFWREGDGWARKPIAQLEIPGSIREAVRARVEQLSDAGRETLSAASVIGQRFSFEVLRDVTGTDERALEAQIREFIEQQLVSETSESQDEYAFRHALTREVVYDDLLVRERKRLHRAVADPLSKGKTPPALLAHHLLAAGETARAVPALLEAGRLALRAAAPREAAAHYERVLEIEPPDDELAGVLEQLAEAYHLFDVARSLKAAEEAATVYEQRGDRLGQSRALRLASRNHWLVGAYVASHRLADRAVEVLADEPSVELARALTNLAGLHMLGGREGAIPVADRAIELAERFDDAWALSNALVSKGTALARNDAVEGMDLIERGRRLAMTAELTTTAMRAWNNASIWQIALRLGPQERLAFAQAGIEWGTARGLEAAAMLWVINATIEPLIALARWDDALRAVETVAAHPPGLGRTYRVQLGMARNGPESYVGEVAAMLEFAGRPDVEAQAYVPLTAMSALVRSLTGDAEGAGELMDRVCAQAQVDEPVRFSVAGPSHSLALSVAYATGMRAIVDIVADETVTGPADLMATRLASAAAARAVLDGDLPLAGRRLQDLLERQRRLWGADNDAIFEIVFAARRAGPAIAAMPEWREPLRRAREFATQVNAHWWLEQLPEPRS